MDGSGSKPGVPLAACQGLALKGVNKFIDRVPHDNATLVHIPIRIPDNLDIRGQLETTENFTTRPGH